MAKRQITPLSEEVDKLLYIKGLKRKYLAEKLGVSQSFISHILIGKAPMPIEASDRIAEALDTNASDLRRLSLKKAM